MRKSFALELHGEPSEFAAEHDQYANLTKFFASPLASKKLFCNCSQSFVGPSDRLILLLLYLLGVKFDPVRQ